MMKRKLICILCVIAMLASSVCAYADDDASTTAQDSYSTIIEDTSLTVEADDTADSEESVEETAVPKVGDVFTIDDAVSYAMENDLGLKAVKANVDSAEYAYDAASILKKEYIDSALGGDSISAFLIRYGYSKDAANLNYRIAERAVTQYEYNLTANVQTAFYTYISDCDKVELDEAALESAQARYDEALAKLELGSISQLECDQFKLAVESAQNDLDSDIRTRDLQMMTLKNTINYPQDQELKVTGAFTRQPMDSTEVEDAVTLSATNITRVNLDETMENTDSKMAFYVRFYGVADYRELEAPYEEKLELYKKAIRSKEYDCWQQLADYEAALADYNANVNSLEVSIYQAYNTMQSVYAQLDYLDASLALSERQLEASKLQYEMGLITAIDYIEDAQSVDSLKKTITDTELSAWQTVVSYRSTYTYEAPEIADLED